ncbi:MAG: hypothetical protein K0Q79_1495 [Flavipsychrobacter sp.]|jgi:hypothetical protein|nr:hypothetical protein [Flavipsychrobacter sp.]
MGKTIDQWQAELIAAKNADPVIGTGGSSELSSTSLVSVWRLWTRIVASAMFDLGNLFDFHKEEVQSIIAKEKAHTLQWYVTKSRAFQFGASLPADADVYDPVAPAGDPSLIVAFAAAVELGNEIRIKVAKLSGSVLTKLFASELTAFRSYMQRIKDAGVRLNCTSDDPDTFQPTMEIHYDPLILNSSGQRLDGTAMEPVKDAVNAFLASIPFNGRFILDDFIAAMMAVDGVKVAEVTSAEAFYGGYSPFLIANWYTPDAGYLALDNTFFAANVHYHAYS